MVEVIESLPIILPALFALAGLLLLVLALLSKPDEPTDISGNIKIPAIPPNTKRVLIALSLILLIGGTLWVYKSTSSTTVSPTTPVAAVLCPIHDKTPKNVQLTACAWNLFNGGRPEDAIIIAEKCIDEFGGQALREQQEFTASGSPTPPVGEVSENEKNEILSRGVLNDLPTCYFIKGQALEELDRISEAKEAYIGARQFPDARTWDSSVGIFWSPAQKATDRLAKLP